MMTLFQDHDIMNEAIIRYFDVNVTGTHILSRVPVEIFNTTHLSITLLLSNDDVIPKTLSMPFSFFTMTSQS